MHALTLLLITLFFGRWAELIPLAVLAAIVLVVAYRLSEWRVFVHELRAPRSDAIVMVTTFLLTLLVDLTVGIGVGMVLAAFLFMKRMAEVTNITIVRREFEEAGRAAGDDRGAIYRRKIPPGVEVYEINGPFFFGAAEKFKQTLGEVSRRPKVLVIRMRNVPAIDSTAMHALKDLVRRTRSEGTHVLLSDVRSQPLVALGRSGLLDEIGEDEPVRRRGRGAGGGAPAIAARDGLTSSRSACLSPGAGRPFCHGSGSSARGPRGRQDGRAGAGDLGGRERPTGVRAPARGGPPLPRPGAPHRDHRPPGAGKSTLVERLVIAYRAAGLRVGVVAVDPTSPFTGGALLGDRIRMESVALDEGVYIRSMASRGSLGGLATSTREVSDLLDAAGFDRILVETVGVGQSELDVARMADTTILVLVPESGDGIQTLKSGVMEAADIFAVNKADRPGADKLRHEIEVTLGIRRGNAYRNMPAHHGYRASRAVPESAPETAAPAAGDGPWEHPVVLTVAAKGEGIDQLVAALDRHHEWLGRSGTLEARRRRRMVERTREVVDRAARRWMWDETHAEQLISDRLDQMVDGKLSPYDVATEVLDGLKQGARL